jgi:hypothetical protein
MNINQKLENSNLEIASIVSAKDHMPYVQFVWNDLRAQMKQLNFA